MTNQLKTPNVRGIELETTLSGQNLTIPNRELGRRALELFGRKYYKLLSMIQSFLWDLQRIPSVSSCSKRIPCGNGFSGPLVGAEQRGVACKHRITTS